ncbi:MAG: 4-hydroxyphenylpyruvate dioxygenase [Chroococcidiopsidaceae cyanobacterium CP_BM_RX_35]|nr:4-hydroxyphenylpyruvate dioxygenase [Chroococcidiopsidaceae cyanobacterium CP_BM_RX_35]
MNINHVHIYVEDAKASCNWFVKHLGFQAVASGVSGDHTCTEVVSNGPVCFVLSSPLAESSPVAQFLRQHPPGIADIAFRVADVAAVMNRAIAQGATVLQPLQQHQQGQEYRLWGKIAAWGSLSHTLVQQSAFTQLTLPGMEASLLAFDQSQPTSYTFTGIDHVVLNVATGDLERAVTWYRNTLDFQYQQTFKIQTDHSALHSQVLVSKQGNVQFPINEPASPNSQIQEFLNINRGPGVQHIALQTPDIVQTIAQLRQRGLPLLPVSPNYYTQLQQRQGLPLSAAQLQEIAQAQILIDWEDTTPQALLLQIFSQPIFRQPTFFFEFIERRFQAQGFGEGNFRALFEAIEREQQKRGSLG